jgi:hypothetical protein
MARHMSKQDETQAKTRALGEPTWGALGRTLSASLLRAVTGGDEGDPHLELPHPPPDTQG